MEGKLAAFRLAGVHLNWRREAIYVALVAAEICWAAPVFLLFTQIRIPHQPLLLWLAMVILLLGFFYLYRALAAGNFSRLLQQGLLVLALLLSIGLVLRFHVYANAGLRGVEWLLQPFRSFADLGTMMPIEFIAIMTLIYLWARGVHLARRSLSAYSVGFSFRSGVILLICFGLAVSLFSNQDISGFVAPYFFFSLIAVALARVEEISHLPNSSQVHFSGFWIGSTIVAVSLLIVLSAVVAVLFQGGRLEQMLHWLTPLLLLVELLIIGVGILILWLLELIVSLLPVNWGALRDGLQRAMEALWAFAETFAELADAEDTSVAPDFGPARSALLTAFIVAVILLVVVLTWRRLRRGQDQDSDESRESLYGTEALAQSLLAMIQSGRDRLSQLVGLVDQFGLGSRLLSAITIQRIYTNLVRLATRAGYPRLQAQTPYEYLETLHKALPGREADVELITGAYISAHYGRVPDSREELQRIRECWERVQTQGIESRA
jgi:hypothetical protein